jgi:uncharacterized protein (DUF1330 family)
MGCGGKPTHYGRSPDHMARPKAIAAGGRFLARGGTAKMYEAGINLRTVLIEFDSVAQAIATHDSPGYQAALKVFGQCGRTGHPHR